MAGPSRRGLEFSRMKAQFRVAVVIKIQRQAAATPARAREGERRGGIEKAPVIEQQFIARAHARAMAVMFFKSIASEAHCLQSPRGRTAAAGEKYIRHAVPVEIRQRQALPKRVPIGRERRRGIGEDAVSARENLPRVQAKILTYALRDMPISCVSCKVASMTGPISIEAYVFVNHRIHRPTKNRFLI